MSGRPNLIVMNLPYDTSSTNFLQTQRREENRVPHTNSSGSNAVRNTLPRNHCKFFQLGSCRNGIRCNYLHITNNNTDLPFSGPVLGATCSLNPARICTVATTEIHDSWVNAAEFVPKTTAQVTLEPVQDVNTSITRSREMTCGICFEIVMDKPDREQRFGILPNCNHCFCLTCIRKWRQAKQFDNKIIRACPECRVTSDYVCPSVYWVDAKEGKDKLLTDYKHALSLKPCKYFKQGSAKCPFGNKCFYLHALPDGTKTDVGPPQRQRRQNREAEMDMLQQIFLWDFWDERDHWVYSLDDLEDLVDLFSETEDSDRSEYDLFFD